MRNFWKILFPLLVPVGVSFHSSADILISSIELLSFKDFMILFGVNAIWMTSPHFVLILFTPYDRDIATYNVPSLWFLDVFLIGFIFWINLQFSARDSAFLWIAYFPMALLFVYFFNLFWPRSNL
jgi:hypothetical protein